MKRTLILILIASLLLCGCGKTEETEERFVIEYGQSFDGGFGSVRIIRDTETGKSYILMRSGYGMGLLEVDNG